MSYEGDSVLHENSIESQNDAIIQRLDKMIFLLEIVADLQPGESDGI